MNMLKEIGSYIDIDEDDLAKIYTLAFKHAQRMAVQPGQVSVGHYYSNGGDGAQFSVREVIGLSNGPSGGMLVTYKIVSGDGQGATASNTLTNFNNWQRHEVILDKGIWHSIVRRHPAE